MKPKPYTLDWWLSMLWQTQLKQHDTSRKVFHRYVHLMLWIWDRILRKYGERPE